MAYLNSAAPQVIGAAAGFSGGIGVSVDQLTDSGFCHGMRAGAGAAGMVAGLKRD